MIFRILAAFVLAPILPCALLATPLFLEYPGRGDGWQFLFWMLVGSELLVVVAAMPSYFILQRIVRVGWLQCVLLGVGIGAAFSLIALLLSLHPGMNYSVGDGGGYIVENGRYTLHGWIQLAKGTGFAALFGASIGLAFWGLAFWSPRTRDAQPT